MHTHKRRRKKESGKENDGKEIHNFANWHPVFMEMNHKYALSDVDVRIIIRVNFSKCQRKMVTRLSSTHPYTYSETHLHASPIESASNYYLNLVFRFKFDFIFIFYFLFLFSFNFFRVRSFSHFLNVASHLYWLIRLVSIKSSSKHLIERQRKKRLDVHIPNKIHS